MCEPRCRNKPCPGTWRRRRNGAKRKGHAGSEGIRSGSGASLEPSESRVSWCSQSLRMCPGQLPATKENNTHTALSMVAGSILPCLGLRFRIYRMLATCRKLPFHNEASWSIVQVRGGGGSGWAPSCFLEFVGVCVYVLCAYILDVCVHVDTVWCVYKCVYSQPVRRLQLKQMPIWVLCPPNPESPLGVIHTLVSPLSALLKEARLEDLNPVCILESPGISLKTPVLATPDQSEPEQGPGVGI